MTQRVQFERKMTPWDTGRQIRKPLLYPPELQGRNLAEIGEFEYLTSAMRTQRLFPELYPQVIVKIILEPIKR